MAQKERLEAEARRASDKAEQLKQEAKQVRGALAGKVQGFSPQDVMTDEVKAAARLATKAGVHAWRGKEEASRQVAALDAAKAFWATLEKSREATPIVGGRQCLVEARELRSKA